MSEAETKKEIYILDTNVLIDLALWLPMDVYQKTWAQIEVSLQKGQWVLLDVIANEIRNKELKDWCKSQKNGGFVTKLHNDERTRGAEINNAYQMIDPISQKSETDTYLIAHAEKYGLTIFTREASRKPNDVLYKIPEVCDLLGVKYTRNPKAFYKHIVLAS